MEIRTNGRDPIADGQVPTEQFSFNYEQIHFDPATDRHRDWINLLSVSTGA